MPEIGFHRSGFAVGGSVTETGKESVSCTAASAAARSFASSGEGQRWKWTPSTRPQPLDSARIFERARAQSEPAAAPRPATAVAAPSSPSTVRTSGRLNGVGGGGRAVIVPDRDIVAAGTSVSYTHLRAH